MSAAELGRIERTIRLLDPEDLRLLAQLAVLGATLERAGTPDARLAALYAGHLGGAALTASGCVQPYDPYAGRALLVDSEDAFSGEPRELPGASLVTPLGTLVLRFMGWTA